MEGILWSTYDEEYAFILGSLTTKLQRGDTCVKSLFVCPLRITTCGGVKELKVHRVRN